MNNLKPVAEVSQETFSDDGTSDIITCNLPIGTKLYAIPDGCVVVPRELLRRVAFEVVGLEIASGLNADATDELRALLGKESEI